MRAFFGQYFGVVLILLGLALVLTVVVFRKRWFERGQRVRVDADMNVGIGTVQSTFTDGLHYVFLEDEQRLITVPGYMLTAIEDAPTAIEVCEPQQRHQRTE